MSEHHPLFAPSSFPALQHCCHYRASGESDQYNERGQRIHDLVAMNVRSRLNHAQIFDRKLLKAPKDERDAAQWAASKLMDLLGEGIVLNHRVVIRDPLTDEVVTFGECDAYNWAGDWLCIADIKSGQKDDYSAQVAIYALGLMEATGTEACRCYILYCDTQEVGEYYFTISEAGMLFFNTIRRVTEATEPLTVNPYCSRCRLQATCPAWIAPASRAVVPLEPSLEAQFIGGLEKVAADPKLLGEFLIAWEMAETLVEKHGLKSKAIQYLRDNKDVAGWKLSFRRGREHFTEKEVRRFLREWLPRLAIKEVVQLIRVLPKEWGEFYDKNFVKGKARGPAPIQASRAKGYAALIRRKKK